MKLTYDPDCNLAYLYVVDEIEPKEVKRTLSFNNIQLDFDSNGKLLGLEFLDARETLREELLASAESQAAPEEP